MVEDKIETILQADALQGLPMASESNVFPVIPDTDSFLLVPKNNDEDEGKVGGPTTTTNNGGGHVRRFSTGNITIPYTKVKILSRYLATSTGSCHDYCKYGMRKEGEEDDHEAEAHNNNNFNNNNNNTSTLKRFNDTLGKGHHHDMFKQAAATLMERRKKMAISHVTPAKTMAMMSSCFGSPKPDSPLPAGRREKEVAYNKKTTSSSVVSEVGAVVGGSPKPRRLDHHSVTKNNNGNPSRFGSSSTSELGVSSSPKSHALMKRDVSPFVKSRNTPLSKLGTPSSFSSSNSELAASSPKPQKPRRSVSVSKVETSSSSANKLPILSKVFSSSLSSSLAEVGVPSSGNNYPKPQRVEAFVSLFHRRGASMSKLSLSSSALNVDVIEDSSKISLGTQQKRSKSLLPKSLSAKEDRRGQRSKKLEAASVVSLSNGKSTKGSIRSEEKESVISSPARHKFLRRQSISEPLKSPATKTTTRLNRDKSENRKATSHSKEDHPATNSNNANKVDHETYSQLKNQQVQDPIISTSVVNERNIKTDVEAATTMDERGSTTAYSPANYKLEANKENITTQSSTSSSTRTRKILKRAQKNYVHGSRSSPLTFHHDKYKINLRRSRARSVISEPMAGSKDCHSVISSTESCETDIVLEHKSMERVLASGTAHTTTTRRTRRGTILRIGDHNTKDEQPRKLNFRAGRVIEFKPEITSPRRLKFKRRAPRSESSRSKVEVNFGVLRKGGGGRREGINRRVEFADQVVDVAERVVLRHQEMQGARVVSQASLNNVIEETASKLVEDRKSKVKALVGAFESLITLQDSKPVPTITV